jgi:hypothetical protein
METLFRNLELNLFIRRSGVAAASVFTRCVGQLMHLKRNMICGRDGDLAKLPNVDLVSKPKWQFPFALEMLTP